MNTAVTVHSTDLWVKIVEMLQQNWAAIEADGADAVRVYFISDTSGVFDEMSFDSMAAAREALGRNGFRRFAEHSDLDALLRLPSPPYHRAAHPQRADLLVRAFLAILITCRRCSIRLAVQLGASELFPCISRRSMPAGR